MSFRCNFLLPLGGPLSDALSGILPTFHAARSGRVGLTLWVLISLAPWGPLGYCQPPKPRSAAADALEPADAAVVRDDEHSEYLRQQIETLNHDNYRARQLARWRLEQTPADSLREVERCVRSINHNAASQLIDLVSSLAMHSDSAISLRAAALLEQLADDASSVGHLAKNTLKAIADLQEAQAIEILSYMGAYIGRQDFPVNGRQAFDGSNDYGALRIDERFQGTDDAIQRIRFLKSVEAIYFRGPGIDSRFYEAIGELPQIKIIKLNHVALTADDLKRFDSMLGLEHLDLNYVDVDDSIIPQLLELPINQSLRLYGTKITPAGEEQLVKQLDGIEIYRGNGGFLGVGTGPATTVVTTVTPGSAADEAGIFRNDRLTHVNDVPIKTFDDLRAELGKKSAGEEVEIRLTRGGVELVLDVELRESPD